jgi:hypothetical protein
MADKQLRNRALLRLPNYCCLWMLTSSRLPALHAGTYRCLAPPAARAHRVHRVGLGGHAGSGARRARRQTHRWRVAQHGHLAAIQFRRPFIVVITWHYFDGSEEGGDQSLDTIGRGVVRSYVDREGAGCFLMYGQQPDCFSWVAFPISPSQSPDCYLPPVASHHCPA